MRERIRNLYWSGSLHNDLHLQQPHADEISDELEEDMQLSVSSRSQEAVSRTDGITENATNLIIRPVDSSIAEERTSRPQVVSDEEGSRYHRSKPRAHKRVDRFMGTEYVKNDSDSDDEYIIHHSSRRDETGPPPKKTRMLQSRDVSPRDLHTTHEGDGLKVPSRSAQKRAYWVGKGGSEQSRQDS